MNQVPSSDSDNTDKLFLGENYEMVVVRASPSDSKTFRSLSLSRLPALTSRLSRVTARPDASARLPTSVADAFLRCETIARWNSRGCNYEFRLGH